MAPGDFGAAFQAWLAGGLEAIAQSSLDRRAQAQARYQLFEVSRLGGPEAGSGRRPAGPQGAEVRDAVVTLQEEALRSIGRTAGIPGGRPRISDAKAWLRGQGQQGAALAARLGRISACRNFASHPDVGFSQDLDGFLMPLRDVGDEAGAEEKMVREEGEGANVVLEKGGAKGDTADDEFVQLEAMEKSAAERAEVFEAALEASKLHTLEVERSGQMREKELLVKLEAAEKIAAEVELEGQEREQAMLESVSECGAAYRAALEESSLQAREAEQAGQQRAKELLEQLKAAEAAGKAAAERVATCEATLAQFVLRCRCSVGRC